MSCPHNVTRRYVWPYIDGMEQYWQMLVPAASLYPGEDRYQSLSNVNSVGRGGGRVMAEATLSATVCTAGPTGSCAARGREPTRPASPHPPLPYSQPHRANEDVSWLTTKRGHAATTIASASFNEVAHLIRHVSLLNQGPRTGQSGALCLGPV